MKLRTVLLVLTLSFIVTFAKAADYPRRIDFEQGHVIIHAPQIQSWQGFKRMEVIAVLEAHPKDNEKVIFANATFTAKAKADVDRRIVKVTDIEVTNIAFVDGTPAKQEYVDMLQSSIPVSSKEIPLDLVLAHVSDDYSVEQTPGLKVDPPTIFYSDEPAILVQIQGMEVLVKVNEKELFFVANTNWSLFKENDAWYLLNDVQWLTSSSLKGPWKVAGKLPQSLTTLAPDGNFKTASSAAAIWAGNRGNLPEVFVSNEPAELILTEGNPDLVPVNGKLLSVEDTVSPLFQHRGTWYFLVSGRWFSTQDLEKGPWTFVSELPGEFSSIDADGPYADIRASVAGTPEATAAVIEAQLPRTASVARGAKPGLDVSYAGTSQFELIEGTKISRAVNTQHDVLKLNGKYYWCLDGAWYVAESANGPWVVAEMLPADIYDIPPSSPSHHTTYVYVYEEDDGPEISGHISFGFSAGYYGMYVGYGTPYWGTGYYYSPYYYYDPLNPYYPIYYPYPYTYGRSNFYNPNTGTFGSVSRAYGPYGGYGYGSAYNPKTGRYAAAEAVWDNDEWALVGAAGNPRTGRSFETARYYNADDDRWEIDSRLSGERGTVDISRRIDDGQRDTSISTSRGGYGDFRRTENTDGSISGTGKFNFADGRQLSSESQFNNGQGNLNLSGSDGASAVLRRTTDSYYGAARSANGDLYGGANGNVFRRTDDGWYRRNQGDWQKLQKPSGNRQKNLNRNYNARQRGMSSSRQRGMSGARPQGRLRRRG